MPEGVLEESWDEIKKMSEDEFALRSARIMNRTENPEPEKKDNEDAIAGEGLIQIPRDKYITQIVGCGYKQYPQYYSPNSKDKGRRIIFTHKILEGEHKGLLLQQYYTRYDVFTSAMEYYQAYVLLLKGVPPKKSDRMPAKAFLGAVCEVWVDFTKRKSRSGDTKQECLQHSIVKEIIQILRKEEIKDDNHR